ncbi:M56 family metallopeptidase [Paenibacillus ginsengarvi]|uniref:M56 family peptidase n=1 Tax=Paenibacillus ginsengarvi TaxID=400777 RepID=A0A3B0BZC7_9BACL|nr:M56 family metallopeptidase [Paenibacillus ginsengarvi]RKN79015.1 M56 family peptidase [Paenibacillus ginsengarvi]
MNWNLRSRRLFWTSTLFAGLLLAQMVTYMLQTVIELNLGLNVFTACHGLLTALGLPALAYLLDALVVYTLVSAIWKTAAQVLSTRKARKRFLRLADTKKTEELRRRFAWSEPLELAVIRHPSSMAFTMGLYRPLIVLSSGLLELLSDRELEAVIRHERHHQLSRDPLVSFLLELFASVFSYLPILRWTSGQHRIAREVVADQYATACMGTFEFLAGALLKLARSAAPARKPFSYSSFAETSINCRIMQMVDPEAGPPLRMPLRLAALSAGVTALLTAAFCAGLLH